MTFGDESFLQDARFDGAAPRRSPHSMTQVPIFYINLKARIDRRDFMEEQFQRLGLAAERIGAVTPEAVPADYLRRYGDPRRARWLTAGEIACSLSHLAAMRAVSESGAPWGCIFEDDVHLSPALPKLLGAVAADPPVVDVLRIESTYRPFLMRPANDVLIEGFRPYHLYGLPVGAAGYAISAGAARMVVQKEMLLGHVADDIFSPFEAKFRRLHIRQLSPALCAQVQPQPNDTVSTSDLDRQRRQRDAMEKRHGWHDLWRRVQLFLDRDIRQGGQKTWHQLRGARKVFAEFLTD